MRVETFHNREMRSLAVVVWTEFEEGLYPLKVEDGTFIVSIDTFRMFKMPYTDVHLQERSIETPIFTLRTMNPHQREMIQDASSIGDNGEFTKHREESLLGHVIADPICLTERLEEKLAKMVVKHCL